MNVLVPPSLGRDLRVRPGPARRPRTARPRSEPQVNWSIQAPAPAEQLWPGYPEPRKLETIRSTGPMRPVPVTIPGAGRARWLGPVEWGEETSGMFFIEQVIRGDAIFTQNGREHLVREGEVYMVQMGARYRYRTGPSGILHKRFCCFLGPQLPALLNTFGLLGRDVVRPLDPVAVTRLLRQSLALMGKGPRDWESRLTLTAYGLLVELSRGMEAEPQSDISDLLAYLERYFNQPLALEDLCRRSGLRPSQLSKLFRKHVGMPPMQYLARQRMAWGKRLLQDSGYSVKEVAQAVGFADPLHFSAQFKKHCGLSPLAYRRATVG